MAKSLGSTVAKRFCTSSLDESMYTRLLESIWHKLSTEGALLGLRFVFGEDV